MITYMLIIFVILFLFCQLPNLFLHIFHAVNIRLGNVISQSYVTQWANFLLILNSSFNFVIYSSLSQTFRDEAKKIFKRNFIVQLLEKHYKEYHPVLETNTKTDYRTVSKTPRQNNCEMKALTENIS